jgi:glycine cleavage system H lipoate-binding protein
MRDDVFHFNSLEPSAAECVWMQAGVVGYKLCDRQFDCEHCPFDLAIRDGGHIASDRPQEPHTTHECPPLAASHAERADVFRPVACEINGAVFYHQGHVWARVEDEGRVRVGLDDFGQRLVGRIYSVALPTPGTQAQAGTTCWRISHQAGDTPLLAPVPGIVEQVNAKLAERPSLVNRDPYGEGWAFVLEPTHLEHALKPLYYGERAAHWFACEVMRLRNEAATLLQHSSPDVGATMTDGGLAVADLHLLLDPDPFHQLINSFLSNPANAQNANEAGKGR